MTAFEFCSVIISTNTAIEDGLSAVIRHFVFRRLTRHPGDCLQLLRPDPAEQGDGAEL